MLIEEALFFKL